MVSKIKKKTENIKNFDPLSHYLSHDACTYISAYADNVHATIVVFIHLLISRIVFPPKQADASDLQNNNPVTQLFSQTTRSWMYVFTDDLGTGSWHKMPAVLYYI